VEQEERSCSGDSTCGDSDWYEITPSQASSLLICGVAEYPVSVGLIDGRQGCENAEIIDIQNGNPYVEVCLELEVEAGTYWIWTGPSVFTGVPCGSEYLLTIDGYVPPPTHAPGSDPRTSVGLLHPCSPDPFVSQTTLRFELARSAWVRLGIHSVAGRHITTLIDRTLEAGVHSVAWHGDDQLGSMVPSGVYFGIFDVDGYRQSRRMVRLR
jgi:hypothetical protein